MYNVYSQKINYDHTVTQEWLASFEDREDALKYRSEVIEEQKSRNEELYSDIICIREKR